MDVNTASIGHDYETDYPGFSTSIHVNETKSHVLFANWAIIHEIQMKSNFITIIMIIRFLILYIHMFVLSSKHREGL